MTDALASFTGILNTVVCGCLPLWGPPLLGAGLLQLQRVGPPLLQCEAAPSSGSSLRSGSTDSITRPSAAVACGPYSAGSGAVVQGLRCSVACGISPDQGSNPGPLHWLLDSYPLLHQGSPLSPGILITNITKM